MQNSLKKCLSKEDNEISNSKDKTNRYVRNRSKSCSDKDRVSWEGKDLTAMKEIKSEASTPTIVEQKGSMRSCVNSEGKKPTTLTSTRSTRSQNPAFVAKHKNFLQKINANLSSPNCEISESSSSGMSSYSVKLAAKRKRERSADPPDKNDLKHEENQRVKILKIHDENSTAKSQNDKYCWICHREAVVLSCQTCVRSFHLRCAQLDAMPSTAWMCTVCATVMHAENVDTRSRAMRQLSLDKFCGLLKHALNRLKSLTGTEPFWKPVDQTEFPRYREFVTYPMDFSLLESNIRKKAYGSTEGFIADVKWILHDCIVFNTHHTKLSSTAKYILKVCKQEMTEIETCPDCYHYAHTRKDSWFTEVCHKPHILVWAKLKGFPFWPGKVMRTNNDSVDVRFFGDHDRAWIPVQNCFLYSEENPAPVRTKKQELQMCIEEIEDHIQRLREKFGKFNLPLNRTPFNPSENQLQIFLPTYKAEEFPSVRRSRSKSRLYQGILELKEKKITSDSEQHILKEPNSVRSSPAEPTSKSSKRSKLSNGTLSLEEKSDLDNKIGSASLTDWAKFEEEAAEIKLTQNIVEDDDYEDQDDQEENTPKRLRYENDVSNIHETAEKINIEGIVSIIQNKLNAAEQTDKKLKCDYSDDNSRLDEKREIDRKIVESKHTTSKTPGEPENNVIKCIDKTLINSLQSTEINSQPKNDSCVDFTTKVSKTFSAIDDEVINKDENCEDDKNLNCGNTLELKNVVHSKVSLDDLHPLVTGDNFSSSNENSSKYNVSVGTESVEYLSSAIENDDCKKDDKKENVEETNALVKAKGYLYHVSNTDEVSITMAKAGSSHIVIKDTKEVSEEISITIDVTKSRSVMDKGNDSQYANKEHTTESIESKSSDEDVTIEQIPPINLNSNVFNESEKLGLDNLNKCVLSEHVESILPVISTDDSPVKEKSNLSPNSSKPSAEKEGCILQVVSSSSSLEDIDTSGTRLLDIKLLKPTDEKSQKISDTSPSRILENDKSSNVDVIISNETNHSVSSKTVETSLEEKCLNECEGVPQNSESSSPEVELNTCKEIECDEQFSDTGTRNEKEPIIHLTKIKEEPPEVSCEAVDSDSRLYDTMTYNSSLQEMSTSPSEVSGPTKPSIKVRQNLLSTSIEDSEPTKGNSPASVSDRDIIPSFLYPEQTMTIGTGADDVKQNSDIQKLENINLPEVNSSVIIPKAISVSLVSNKKESSKPNRRNSSGFDIETVQTIGEVSLVNRTVGNKFYSTSKNSSPCDENVDSSVIQAKSKARKTIVGKRTNVRRVSDNNSPFIMNGNKTSPVGSNQSRPGQNCPPPVQSASFGNLPEHSVQPPIGSMVFMAPGNTSNRCPPTYNIGQLPSCKSAVSTSFPPILPNISDVRFPLIPSESGPASAELNRHADKLASLLRGSIEEMLRDLSNVGNARATIKTLQLEIERLQWRHQQELAELKRNSDLILVELRASMASDHERAMAEALRQCEIEKNRAIEETKKKQWCTFCGKEALLYCCWNTSYCDYPCQSRHWPQHMSSCGQAEANKNREDVSQQQSPPCNRVPLQKSQISLDSVISDSNCIPGNGNPTNIEGDCDVDSTNSETYTSTQKVFKYKARKHRCGSCVGCKSEKCGKCPPCNNIKTHQVCKQRRCLNLQYERVKSERDQKASHLMVPSVPLPAMNKPQGSLIQQMVGPQQNNRPRFPQYSVLTRPPTAVQGQHMLSSYAVYPRNVGNLLGPQYPPRFNIRPPHYFM